MDLLVQTETDKIIDLFIRLQQLAPAANLDKRVNTLMALIKKKTSLLTDLSGRIITNVLSFRDRKISNLYNEVTQTYSTELEAIRNCIPFNRVSVLASD